MTPSSDFPLTEREQELADQYTQIATLVGSLAHEIKNPLSTIRLNIDLLAEDLEHPQTPRERRAAAKMEAVQRECQRLQQLLDDFLRFAKVQSLELQPGDLNSLVARLLDFFEPEAAKSRIEVIRYLDPNLPHVMMDAETLYAAMLNLVINAQQAMPDGGQLVVRTRGTKSGVAVDFIDTGGGMDQKTIGRAFNAFFTTKPDGSGLGLPTTRKILEAHGGTLSVQSEVGRGTQFTIELPVPARLTR